MIYAIAAGAAADIVLSAPAPVEDRATCNNAHQYPVGIAKVIVNAQLVIDNGPHTGARAGLVLRS